MGERSSETFDELRSAMTMLPILMIPDFCKPFVLETDASKGLGDVLL